MSHVHEHRSFGSYLLLSAAFNAGAIGLGALLGARPRIPAGDLILLGAATHEISRIVAKDRIARPLRRPFVEVRPNGHETPRPNGARHALGELLTCPYCVGPWVALGLSASYLLAPAMTRTYSAVLAITAMSDFLHRGAGVVEAKRRELTRRAATSELAPSGQG